MTNNKWERSAHYCPCCGEEKVYRQEDSEDYYVGAIYLCLACLAESHLDLISEAKFKYQIEQRTKIKEKLS